ncbi:hypothetical protein [Sphingomonas bacterium]|uniref:hypothetical protein n=1 Tax=Sphingomonas bacterium TaxID=1895847 RepID=UPI0026278A81|nr:hypothetical protein [Sphingomonas bacterium]MDB5679980.1 hypothetical protein [Sphingomonas bacterium]
MKLYAIAALAVACSLPATGGSAVPTAKKAPAKSAPFAISPITLAATGLIIPGTIGQGPRTLAFGSPRTKAIAMVSGELGAPIKTGVYPDCGQGHAVGYAKFRSGIELTFVAAKFVGWTLEPGGDKRNLTANGVGIGTTVATLQKLFPDVFIDPGNEEGSGMGPGFTSDTWPNGWLDGDKKTSKVTSMYAGETCIAA